MTKKSAQQKRRLTRKALLSYEERMKPRKCKLDECATVFTPNRPDREFCSTKCRNRFNYLNIKKNFNTVVVRVPK